MQKEVIFTGTLGHYWRIVFSFWEGEQSGDMFGTEPFKVPPKAQADFIPSNQTRIVVWWENNIGMQTGQVAAYSLPDGKTRLSIQINDDSESALQGWEKLSGGTAEIFRIRKQYSRRFSKA